MEKKELGEVSEGVIEFDESQREKIIRKYLLDTKLHKIEDAMIDEQSTEILKKEKKKGKKWVDADTDFLQNRKYVCYTDREAINRYKNVIREETETEKEFVWICDIKCTDPVVMRFVKKNGLTAQEAFEREACLHAGSKICDECPWRLKE